MVDFKLKQLTTLVRANVKDLTEISEGQVFHSKYYGYLGALKSNRISKDIYEIYGYELYKSPLNVRTGFYPRDLELIGKEPMLHDVLKCFSLTPKDKKEKGLTFKFNESIVSKWDLSKPYLRDQSEKTINHLFDLALQIGILLVNTNKDVIE
jgi:hypothetical protein